MHMARGLTPSEQDLWGRATQDVTPLGQAPVRVSEGLPSVRVSEPRAIEYDPRMDLHAVTVHEAFGRVQEHIYQGVQNGYKRLMIITGRSGQINQEMPRWLERNPRVRSVKQMPNGGSWEVTTKLST